MSVSAKDKLKQELEICALHEDRLNKSLQHLQPYMPLNPQFMKEAKGDELAYLDMLTTRFAKLQDALGKKVFPLILKLIDEFYDEETFADRLNRLEKLRIIDSVEGWRELREIRNALSHEYENDLSKLCDAINFFVTKCADLIKIWNLSKSYILDKKLID